jgi:hypothetical protein
VRVLEQDFRQAMFDYNYVISNRPEFAEAYYNRGMLYLYQGFGANGVNDLGKAGVLGIAGAYNIIKRVTQEE